MSIKLSRREMLLGSAIGPIVMGVHAANADERGEPNAAELLQMNDLDRQVWQQELDEFVPARIYDMHPHLSRAEFNLDPKVKDTDRVGLIRPMRCALAGIITS